MDGGTGAGVTVNSTGTETAVAPVAMTEIVALYVPAVREPIVTDAVKEPFPEPDAGLNVSQLAESLADQLSVPPPTLLILMICPAGLLPPCCAVKDKLAGLMLRAGFVGGTGGGTGVELEAGTTICVIPGISDIRRPNCRGIVLLDVGEDVPPEAAAVRLELKFADFVEVASAGELTALVRDEGAVWTIPMLDETDVTGAGEAVFVDCDRLSPARVAGWTAGVVSE